MDTNWPGGEVAIARQASAPIRARVPYRQKVAALGASLADPVLKDEAAEIIRSLVETITLTPVGDTLVVERHGELASILSLCTASRQHKASQDYSGEALQINLVAGTGFEPVTFRL